MEINEQFLKHLNDRIGQLQKERHAMSKRIECQCPDGGMHDGDEKTIYLVGQANLIQGHLDETRALMSFILAN